MLEGAKQLAGGAREAREVRMGQMTASGASDPSPVSLRLVKAPERGTLSPRERAVHSPVTPPQPRRGIDLRSWMFLSSA